MKQWINQLRDQIYEHLIQNSNFKLTSFKDTLISSSWMLLTVVGMLLLIKVLTMVIK